jgi:hypothetical protein
MPAWILGLSPDSRSAMVRVTGYWIVHHAAPAAISTTTATPTRMDFLFQRQRVRASAGRSPLKNSRALGVRAARSKASACARARFCCGLRDGTGFGVSLRPRATIADTRSKG